MKKFNLKKVFTMLLCLAMVFALGACGKSDTASTGDEDFAQLIGFEDDENTAGAASSGDDTTVSTNSVVSGSTEDYGGSKIESKVEFNSSDPFANIPKRLKGTTVRFASWDDETGEGYRNQSLDYVQQYFKEDIRFNARQLGGVNFVGIDNGYYRFDRGQLAALKEQVALGIPIILFMHNPLFERNLFEFEMVKTKGLCANIVGTPENFLIRNFEKRQPVLKPDEPTAEMYGYIKSQPIIKAVLTGHLHYDFESMITDTLPQYVTGIDTIRRINIF